MTVEQEDVGKKNASRRRAEKRHRRTLKQRNRPRRAPVQRISTHTVSFGQGPIDHDDCPCCIAQRELGIVNGQSLSPEQYAAYRARVDELDAQMGHPLQRETGEDIMRRYEWINARLSEEGAYVDIADMDHLSRAEVARHFERISELTVEYDALN